MKTHMKRRKRERVQAPLALMALKELIPSGVDPRKFLMKHFVFHQNHPPGMDNNNNSSELQTTNFEDVSSHPEEHEDDCIKGQDLARFLEALNATSVVLSSSVRMKGVGEINRSASLIPESTATDVQATPSATPSSTPLKPEDILLITRRVPRSRSTVEQIEVPELCFALHQACAPVDIHERREQHGKPNRSHLLSERSLSQQDWEEEEENFVKRRKTDGGVEEEDTARILTFSTSRCASNESQEKLGSKQREEMSDWPMIRYYKGKLFERLIIDAEPSLLSSSSESIPVENSSRSKNEKSEKEWMAFLSSLSVPLPMTLRIHRNEKALQHIAQFHLRHHPSLTPVIKPASIVTLPSANESSLSTPSAPPPLSPLVPSLAVDVFGCSDAEYHTNEAVKNICRTLHSANAVSFQEVVSMLPVLVLDVQPHHRVLDLCAAPGSKTLHALDEMLNGGWTSAACEGVLIANEKDRVKATQTLPARLKRYHAPNALCVRCDATQWPRLYTQPFDTQEEKNLEAKQEAEEEGKKCRKEEGSRRGCQEVVPGSGVDGGWGELRFNRVICDVPCSGDGTIRKEPSVATTWSSKYVESLVPTQVSLLRRGLELLSPGGILVYSTCSLNPKEDEGVVASVLSSLSEGEVELLNVNEALAAKGIRLHSQGGMKDPSSAIVPGKTDKKKKPQSNVTAGLPETMSLPSSSTCLPSSPCSPQFLWSSAFSTYDGSKVLRVWPHRDNTGGFFVAAFRKRKLLLLSPPAKVAQKLNQWMKGKLWAPVSPNDEEWTSILSFYFGVVDTSVSSCEDDPPRIPYRGDLFRYLIPEQSAATREGPQCRTEQRWVWLDKASCSASATSAEGGRLIPVFHLNPHGGPSRRIVLMTKGVAEILFGSRPYKGPGVEVVAAGVRAFEKYDPKFLPGAGCRWRATVEALSFLGPHMTRRTVRLYCAPTSACSGGSPMSSCSPPQRSVVESLLRHGSASLVEYWPELLLHQNREDNVPSLPGRPPEEGERIHEVPLTPISRTSPPLSCTGASCLPTLLVREHTPLSNLVELVQNEKMNKEEATKRIWKVMSHFDAPSVPSSSLPGKRSPSEVLSTGCSAAHEGVSHDNHECDHYRNEKEEKEMEAEESKVVNNVPSYSLLNDLLIGGVNVEIRWDPTTCPSPFSSTGNELGQTDKPWRLSATLSRHKLELAVDGSLRAFGLMYFCGVQAPMVSGD